jgi:hypothetical protein
MLYLLALAQTCLAHLTYNSVLYRSCFCEYQCSSLGLRQMLAWVKLQCVLLASAGAFVARVECSAGELRRIWRPALYYDLVVLICLRGSIEYLIRALSVRL